MPFHSEHERTLHLQICELLPVLLPVWRGWNSARERTHTLDKFRTEFRGVAPHGEMTAAIEAHELLAGRLDGIEILFCDLHRGHVIFSPLNHKSPT